MQISKNLFTFAVLCCPKKRTVLHAVIFHVPVDSHFCLGFLFFFPRQVDDDKSKFHCLWVNSLMKLKKKKKKEKKKKKKTTVMIMMMMTMMTMTFFQHLLYSFGVGAYLYPHMYISTLPSPCLSCLSEGSGNKRSPETFRWGGAVFWGYV